MAIFYDAPVSPDALTTFVRRVPTPAGNALTALFPEEYSNTNTYDFSEIVRANRVAKYRSLDGRVHVSERDGGNGMSVPLAPLSDSLSMGEYERLQLEFARTGGTNIDAIKDSIYNDAQTLTAQVRNRIELAWGDTLEDGILSIRDEGFEGDADYGLPENHIASAGTGVWTDADASTPLTDLQNWSDVYNETNGADPADMLTSKRVARLLTRSKQVIDAVHGATQGKTSVTMAELVGLLAAEGLPSLLPAYDSQLNVDGENKRVLDAGKVLLLPADKGTLGATRFGMTATALEMLDAAKTEFSFGDLRGIVGLVVKSDGVPFRKHTIVDAIGQPILKDAKRLFVGSVLS